MAAATTEEVGSLGILRSLFGEEGSYVSFTGASTGASCMCVFLALGLEGCKFLEPFGLPFALGFITGFTSSSTTGSDSSSAFAPAIFSTTSWTSSAISSEIS